MLGELRQDASELVQRGNRAFVFLVARKLRKVIVPIGKNIQFLAVTQLICVKVDLF